MFNLSASVPRNFRISSFCILFFILC
uniref:Uncharacterized protein n=1 Tax=Anguilla anguilla TaxID=7936 RepID=A0A0E9UKM9_ANGAN